MRKFDTATPQGCGKAVAEHSIRGAESSASPSLPAHQRGERIFNRSTLASAMNAIEHWRKFRFDRQQVAVRPKRILGCRLFDAGSAPVSSTPR
jgi:hypothetical protein